MNPHVLSTTDLEQLLQQKINEYSKAESDGQSPQELMPLYKELKKIRYQLAMSKTGVSISDSAETN